jgi:hypothetical protein
VHHIEMDATRAEDVGRGMIVVAGSAPPGPRAADRNIVDVAGDRGVDRASANLERARAVVDQFGGDPEAFVRSHVRRLEALRRAGHAERIDADHWRVPADLPAVTHAENIIRRIISEHRAEPDITAMHRTCVDLRRSRTPLLTSDKLIVFVSLSDPNGYIALPIGPDLFIAAFDDRFERQGLGKHGISKPSALPLRRCAA